MAKHYQYVLLDWDDNLAKTLDIWLVAVRVMLERRGIHLDDRAIGATFGHFEVSFRELGIADPIAAIEEAGVLAMQTLPEVELYPDALEVLEYLRDARKHMALVTTSALSSVQPALDKYELMDLFAAVITADDVTHYKPHPEPLEKALAALGGIKDQAIMIGDTEKDVACANNFGIDSILFMPPEHAKFYDFDAMLSHKPTYVVTDFTTIKDLIS